MNIGHQTRQSNMDVRRTSDLSPIIFTWKNKWFHSSPCEK